MFSKLLFGQFGMRTSKGNIIPANRQKLTETWHDTKNHQCNWDVYLNKHTFKGKGVFLKLLSHTVAQRVGAGGGVTTDKGDQVGDARHGLFTVAVEGAGCQCVSSAQNPHNSAGSTVLLMVIKVDEDGVTSQSARCPRKKLNKGHGRRLLWETGIFHL